MTEAAAETLNISRVFAAPRERVFKAWSHADHIRRWFSPSMCSLSDVEVDFRVGGRFVARMHIPGGAQNWMRGRFLEIAAPERLVVEILVEVDGAPRFTALTEVDFATEGAGTRMSVRQSYVLHDPTYSRAIQGAPEGWRTTLDKLGKEVERMADAPRSVVHGEFTLRRSFAASPARVFKALTDKEAKARWFVGPEGYVLKEREMDVRVGGRERVRGEFASGVSPCFDATYLDVVPNERLVYVYEMHINDAKISVSLATMQLAPEGTGTRLTMTEQGAFLDGYDDSGSRARGSAELLDKLAASLEL